MCLPLLLPTCLMPILALLLLLLLELIKDCTLFTHSGYPAQVPIALHP